MDLIWILFIFLLLLGYFTLSVSAKSQRANLPPSIPGLPFLGNALSYKRDPVAFMLSHNKKYGGVFIINLAGHKMVIVTDPSSIHSFQAASEDELSSYNAVVDFGFAKVLGTESVLSGSVLHRLMITSLSQRKNEYTLALSAVIKKSMFAEIGLQRLNAHADKLDMIPFVRKVFLRSSIEFFLSDEVTRRYPTWVEDFYEFQDKLEDAIASAVVSPKFLSNRILTPIQNMRIRLRDQLVPVIDEIRSNPDSKGYLADMIRISNVDPSFRVDSSSVIADFCIGLIFSAHKNPAILCAQTYIQLEENPFYLAKVREEISGVFKGKNNLEAISAEMIGRLPLLECCIKETLRMTSHTIGAIRKATKDFSIRSEGGKNFVIPEGSYVAASHISLAMDERWWTSPKVYDPDRFSANRREELSVPKAYIPFSGGVHLCPGRYIALAMVKIFMSLWVTLLETYSIGKIPALDFERATLGQRRSSVMIHFEIK